MEELNQATKIINQANNLLVVGPKNPSLDELSSAYSLSYTLNKTGKIVNHCPGELAGNYPQIFKPSGLPKTFVITIKSDDVAQLYYERQKKLLNIFLTTKEKFVEEKDIKISPAHAPRLEKCDLIITVGLNNLEMLGELYDENFKLFYQTPILNIDNKESNNRFGNFNLIRGDEPIASILDKLVKSANYKLDPKAKFWMLLGIIDFLKNKEPDEAVLETISDLIGIEIDFDRMVNFLYQEKEKRLLSQAFKTMDFFKGTAIVTFRKDHFEKSGSRPKDLRFVLEKLTRETFRFPKLLVIWEDTPFAKAVFYSKNKKILNNFAGQKKGEGVLLETRFKDVQGAKKELKNLL